jgi:hypothetical protein
MKGNPLKIFFSGMPMKPGSIMAFPLSPRSAVFDRGKHVHAFNSSGLFPSHAYGFKNLRNFPDVIRQKAAKN